MSDVNLDYSPERFPEMDELRMLVGRPEADVAEAMIEPYMSKGALELAEEVKGLRAGDDVVALSAAQEALKRQTRRFYESYETAKHPDGMSPDARKAILSLVVEVSGLPEQAEREAPLSLEIGIGEEPLHGEDSVLADENKRLFGVFDGAGGAGGRPDMASNAAREAFLAVYTHYEAPSTTQQAIEQMKYAMSAARYQVDTEGGRAITTAVAAKIEEINGQPYMIWANAGDSRLFLQTTDNGAIHPISTEQCDSQQRNVITNYLGQGFGGQRDEFGVVMLKDYDRLMLCSDGITGDWNGEFLADYDQYMPEELLTDEEMRDGFDQLSPTQAVGRFIEISKKSDDKSVIVVDVK